MKIRLMVRGAAVGLGDELGLFEWKGSSCIVGRSECELVVVDSYCSLRHALFYQGTEGELRIRDLQSTNGTYVGGEKVDDVALHVGDEIKVGKTVFSLLSFRPDKFSGSLDLALKAKHDKPELTKTHQEVVRSPVPARHQRLLRKTPW